MMTVAPSGAPPKALKFWADGNRIYYEIPGKDGRPPYIGWHYFDHAGVSKCLDLLGLHRIDYEYCGDLAKEYKKLPEVKLNGTATQQAMQEKILRDLGILK